MAADADAGAMDVRVGLGVGGGDGLVHRQAARGGVAGELVRQGDIHVAVGRLHQLDQFGRLGVAHGPHFGASSTAS